MQKVSQRLDKYLAHIGVSSRRGVKKVLKEQMLTVNGIRVKESGTRIEPGDIVKLNGETIEPSQLVYFILNKPKDVISTTIDERGRDTVTEYIPTTERVYPVGRLDKDTTGLILLTNDGELTHKLIHPRYHVPKVYHLTIKGHVTKAQLQAMRTGVLLSDGITLPATVTILKEEKTQSVLEVTLHEGRNRQIRRMCETVGIDLLELKRVSFGPIKLGKLPEGTFRSLTLKEIASLREAAHKPQTTHTA